MKTIAQIRSTPLDPNIKPVGFDSMINTIDRVTDNIDNKIKLKYHKTS